MKSIGDFAENLIAEQIKGVKSGKVMPTYNQPVGASTPQAPDISNVQVPDTFMKEILGESFHPQDTPASDSFPELVWNEEEQEEVTPVPLTEETAQQILPLLEEVKGLLQEMCCAMTTAGNIGVNLAGPQKDSSNFEREEAKRGYKKASAKNKLSATLRKRVR